MKQEEMFITAALSVTPSLVRRHFAAGKKVFCCAFFFWVGGGVRFSCLFTVHISSLLCMLIMGSTKDADRKIALH